MTQAAPEGHVITLVGHLDEAATVCAELCELAALKRRALVGGDVPSLQSVLAREQGAVERLLRAERRGKEALRALGRSCGIPQAVSLSQLEGVLPEPAAAPLRERRARVQGLMAQLRAQTRHNAELLGQALAYVDFCLGVLLPGSRDATYGASGQRPRAVSRAAGLVNREV